MKRIIYAWAAWTSLYGVAAASPGDALAKKIAEMEKKYDHQFQVVFEAIRQLIEPGESPKKRRIGFHAEEDR